MLPVRQQLKCLLNEPDSLAGQPMVDDWLAIERFDCWPVAIKESRFDLQQFRKRRMPDGVSRQG